MNTFLEDSGIILKFYVHAFERNETTSPDSLLHQFNCCNNRNKENAGVVRCVYIGRSRYQHDFGFTLRHFIIYPPETSEDAADLASLRLGQVTEPVDTIFVKSVRPDGPAARAGLCVGDRVVSVNGESISGKSYDQVVQFIQQSPAPLCLGVTPKQYDTLQRFYEEKAYRPETNQRPYGGVLTSGDNNVVSVYVNENRPVYSQPQQQQPRPPPHRNRNNNTFVPYGSKYSSGGGTSSIYENNDPRGGHNQRRNNVYYANNVNGLRGVIPSERYNNVSTDSVFLPISDCSSSNSGYYRNMSTSREESQQPQKAEDGPQQHQQQQFLSHLPRPTPYKSTNIRWTQWTPGGQHPQQHPHVQGEPTYAQLRTYGVTTGSSSNRSHHHYQQQQPSHNQQQHSQPYYPFNQSGASAGALRGIREEGAAAASGAKSHESVLAASALETVPGGGNRYGSMECLPTGPPGYPQQHGNSATNPWRGTPGYRYSISSAGPMDLDCRRDSTISLPPQANVGGLADKSPNKGTLKDMMFHSVDAGELDSPFADRIRKSTQEKEEFLKRPNQPLVWAPSSSVAPGFPKELYAKPQKFQSVPWPPQNVAGSASGASTAVPGGLQQSQSTPNANIAPVGGVSRTSSATSFSHHQQGGGGAEAVADYGSAKNRLTVVGSGKLHCDPPPDWTGPGRPPGANGSSIHPSASNKHSSGGAPSPKQGANQETDVNVQNRNGRPQHFDLFPLKSRKSKHFSLHGTVRNPRVARPDLLFLPSSKGSKSLRIKYAPSFDDSDVILRRRENETEYDNDRVVRRTSYLKATSSPIDMERKSASPTSPAKSPSTEFRHFGSLRSEKSPDGSEVVKNGQVHFKVRAGENKKVGYYRPWKQGFAQLRKSGYLYLSKEHITKDSISCNDESATIICVGLKNGIIVEHADDYSKRKNVIRIRTNAPGAGAAITAPSGSSNTSQPANVTLLASPSSDVPSVLASAEILIQANDEAEMGQWLRFLQQQQQDNNNYYSTVAPTAKPPSSGTTSTDVNTKTNFIKQILGQGQSSGSGGHNISTTNSSASNPVANPTSPRRTWTGKLRHQWHRIHGSSNGGAPSAYGPQGPPENGASFGVLLENCPISTNIPHVPRVLEICVSTMEARGLSMQGIYRIPGNTAAVAALIDAINKGQDPSPEQDPRWNDVHVISSMLKSFLRNLPDPLLTSERYEEFMQGVSDSSEQVQFEKIKALIDDLPMLNFETLRYLILHLKKVSESYERTMMDPRNLAIVFGPTLVRPVDDSVTSMVNYMKQQCKLVELLISHAYDFFPPRETTHSVSSQDSGEASLALTSTVVTPPSPNSSPNVAPATKIETDVRTSIIQAAQRKVSQQQQHKQIPHNTYGLPSTPPGQIVKDRAIDEHGFIKSYTGLGAETEQRVRQFEQETRAMLTRDSRSPNLATGKTSPGALSSMSVGSSQGPLSLPGRKQSPPKPGEDINVRMDKLRLEAEWRKAKDDLENEDFYDQLADNPSSILQHREHGLQQFHRLSHNVSSSSVSSSNSAGDGTRVSVDGSEAYGPAMASVLPWQVKLGPTPFKPTYQSGSTTATSLPPKPPTSLAQLGNGSSPLPGMKVSKFVSSAASGPSSFPEIRKVCSVEHICGDPVTGPFKSEFDQSKVAGRETIQRLKQERQETMQQCQDSKLFGSLDSLRDIVNGTSKEDLSIRSSDGSDLVTTLTKELDKKLEGIRSVENAIIEEQEKKQDVNEVIEIEPKAKPQNLLGTGFRDDKKSAEKATVIKGTNEVWKGRSRSLMDHSRRKTINGGINEGDLKENDEQKDKIGMSYRDPSLYRSLSAKCGSRSVEKRMLELLGQAPESVGSGKDSPKNNKRFGYHKRQSSISLGKDGRPNNRLNKDPRRRHSLSGTVDFLRMVLEERKAASGRPHHHHHLPTADNLATALAANNILESHV